MNDLDEKILAALNAEDAEALSEFESDTSLPTMLVQLYQGRRRWINLACDRGHIRDLWPADLVRIPVL